MFDQLGRKNILEPETAKIDQTEGIKLAIEHGYKNIAVTITLAQDCLKIQELKKAHPDVNIYIFVVHTSNRTKKKPEFFLMYVMLQLPVHPNTLEKSEMLKA